ncbi:helix-turn-helix domain-containing protein [Candidatus Enterococcus clewellii]|uniref:HTH cro/C1-type domain-containing protein n=1 Tax=Candidatus Enterococcus clewellii TaxID=1834193 RepID=A0AAQ3VW16_9ENTE
MIENFGTNIARLRKEKGMTQKELADQLGVNKQTISNIEKGEGYPTFKNLEKLSQILSANPIQLFGTMKEIALSDTPRVLDRIDEYHDKVRDILEVEKILADLHDSYGNPNESFEEIITLSNSVKRLERVFELDENEVYSNLSSVLPSHQIQDEINTLASSLKYLEPIFTETKVLDQRRFEVEYSKGYITEEDIYEDRLPYITYAPKIEKILPSSEIINDIHNLAQDLKYIEKNQ